MDHLRTYCGPMGCTGCLIESDCFLPARWGSAGEKSIAQGRGFGPAKVIQLVLDLDLILCLLAPTVSFPQG